MPPTPPGLRLFVTSRSPDIRAFLGLTGYYREYVKDYARLALPLADLTKNDVPATHQSLPQDAFAAFRALQRAF